MLDKDLEIKQLREAICLLVLASGGEVRISDNTIVSVDFTKLSIEVLDNFNEIIIRVKNA